MNWTPQQNEVIQSRGKNILVSAAAGSGKTAVLIERIKTLIIEDKIDVDKFLITTFTNAAAAEMKSKLEASLRDEIKKPNVDREYLERQLSLIPRANIGTFHTFALEVMRQYFYLTDLEPGFAIADETRVGIMEREALDQVMEERFAEDYDRFTTFLTKYGSDRNEKKIKENILKLYKELRSIPHYIKWARERAELSIKPSPAYELNIISFLYKETYRALEESKKNFEKALDVLMTNKLNRLAAIVEVEFNTILSRQKNLAAIEADVNDRKVDEKVIFKKIAKCAASERLKPIRANATEKESYEKCDEIVKELRKKAKGSLEDIEKKLFYMNIEEINEEFRAQYDDVVYLIGLVDDFRKKVEERKSEEKVVDFDDAMHYAIEILDGGAAAEYRNRFQYIFIDEFQDSNMLQEEIISKISRDDNLFMVGDIKQSIYKFRLAEPEIFRKKYDMFSLESQTKSKKIDLNMNFRSKKNIIDTVNLVFRDIMEGYDENARLHCGVQEKYRGFESRLHIINGKGENGQAEERIIAQIIREKLGEEITDTKLNVKRPVVYRDIVVLARSKSVIANLERYLNNEGIPAYGEAGEGYYSTVEIMVLINILRIIDNMQQDIPLISAMGSVVFDFTVGELAQIRIENRKGSYYSAVMNYAASGENTLIKEKIKKMLDKISGWRNINKTFPLEELVRTIIYDTGYYDYCSGLPMGKQRTLNLKQLIETAAEYESGSFNGLYGFLTYIDAMDKNRLNVSEAKVINEREQAVRIMTVHKSKGLEFPIVILAGAGRSVRGGSISGSALIHKDYGISLPVVNTRYLWHKKSYLQNIIAMKKSREQYEEEIRILYVALTRAKDSLNIVGAVRNMDTLGTIAGRGGSFVDMVYEAFIKGGGIITISGETDDDIGDTFDEKNMGGMHRGQYGTQRLAVTDDKIAEIDRIMSFTYPYDNLKKVKSKYSATELNKIEEGNLNTVPSLIKPSFMRGEKKPDALRIGIVMHLLMEKLDFRRAVICGRGYVEGVIQKLLDDGFLTEEEINLINTDNIMRFFENEIGRRASSSVRLEKEREFLLQKEIDGVPTIIQGVIDCFFEEDDGLILIDYKNSYLAGSTGEREIIKVYRRQLAIYKEALEGATGEKVKEVYLYLFKSGKFIDIFAK